MNKIFTILLTFVICTSCGFKPIYKISDNISNSVGYSVKIINEVSREIEDEINTNILSGENQKYTVLLMISEDLTPLIINTNGTIAKYRIEVAIGYELIDSDSNESISVGTTRGYAQYDVVESEVSNEDTRKSMTKIATKNALQIMTSRIQSRISKQ